MNAFNKLPAVNKSLGAPIGSQDTARTIYDTVTTNGTRFEFFKNFQKTPFECNVNRNKLDAGESMVIQEILLTQENVGGGVIFDGFALLNCTIGNQRVIKDLAVHFESVPELQAFPIKQSVTRYMCIPMITQIVIPPNIEFNLNLDVFTGIAGAKVKAVLVGYGRLFNTNRSF